VAYPRAVAPSDDLAERLVEFDERLATDVLGAVATRLGGADTGDPDLRAAREFLSDPEKARLPALRRLGDVDDSPSTTSEWKSQFAHSERLRTFALALVDALESRGWK
jgi:hypothetical protein